MTMDIEKLKRLNDLARNLKKSGFAQTSEEAAQQANDVYGKDLKDIVPDKPEPEKSSEPVSEQPEPSPAPDDALFEAKMKLLLEMNQKQFQEQISSIRSQLDGLASELASLKQQVKAPRPEKKVPEQKKLPDEKKDSHPRQGEFKSDDVSIEKMFYYGK